MDEPDPVGWIRRIRAKPGFRMALMLRLRECWKPVAGCNDYIVAEDLGDPDVLWVTEFWEGRGIVEEVTKDMQFMDRLGSARAITVKTEFIVEIRPVYAPVTA